MSLRSRLHRAQTPGADVLPDELERSSGVTPRQRPVLLPNVPEWVKRAQRGELPVRIEGGTER